MLFIDFVFIILDFAESKSQENRMSGQKVHQCEVCNMISVSKSALEIHLRVHTGEKPYSCPICSRTFTRKSNVKSHMISHYR